MRAGLVCTVVLLAGCGGASNTATAPPQATALTQNATMRAVVDGDTVDVMIGGRPERVRLIGIDTPETKKPNTPVQCFGPEATRFTTSLLPANMPLHLERDVVARDDFGRMLAYVYSARDGSFVNLRIVREGFARPLTIPPNVAHAADFVAAARSAEADNIGLWRGCTG